MPSEPLTPKHGGHPSLKSFRKVQAARLAVQNIAEGSQAAGIWEKH